MKNKMLFGLLSLTLCGCTAVAQPAYNLKPAEEVIPIHEILPIESEITEDLEEETDKANEETVEEIKEEIVEEVVKEKPEETVATDPSQYEMVMDSKGFLHDVCGNVYDEWGNMVYESPVCLIDHGYDPFADINGNSQELPSNNNDNQVNYETNNYVTDPYGYGIQGTITLPDVGTYTLYRATEAEGQHYIDQGYALIADLGVIGGTGTIIAGHNGRGIFRNLGNLQAGDVITMNTGFGDYSYTVQWTTVEPTDGNIVGYSFENDLILYTCYPFDAAVTDQRFIVFASLNY